MPGTLHRACRTRFAEPIARITIALILCLIAGCQGDLPKTADASDDKLTVAASHRLLLRAELNELAPAVDTTLTVPLVEAVRTIKGVDTIRSSSIDGLTRIWIDVSPSADLDAVRQAITNRLSKARAALPTAMGPPMLGASFESLRWHMAFLRLNDPAAPPVMARSIARERVRVSLERTSSVTMVVGGPPLEVQVIASSPRLASHDIVAHDLLSAISSGLKNAKDLADLEQIVLRNVNGVPIRVRDVAQVRVGIPAGDAARDAAQARARLGAASINAGSATMPATSPSLASGILLAIGSDPHADERRNLREIDAALAGSLRSIREQYPHAELSRTIDGATPNQIEDLVADVNDDVMPGDRLVSGPGATLKLMPAASIQLIVSDTNPFVVNEAADTQQAEMARIAGQPITRIPASADAVTPGYATDPEKAAVTGVGPEQITETLRMATQGIQAGVARVAGFPEPLTASLWIGKGELPGSEPFAGQDRDDGRFLLDLFVRSDAGTLVPLNAFTIVLMERMPRKIFRQDGVPTVILGLTPPAAGTNSTLAQLRAASDRSAGDPPATQPSVRRIWRSSVGD